MPLDSMSVGISGESLRSAIDARWTMAFAAGLGDSRPLYTDTRSRPDVLAHPLFPVCFEWPAFLSTRHLPVGERLSSEERVRGVHASHDLVLHEPLRAGMQPRRAPASAASSAVRPGPSRWCGSRRASSPASRSGRPGTARCSAA